MRPARQAALAGPASRREDAGMTRNPLRLDAQLCFALYAASNRMTRLYRPELVPLGLTYPQYLVLLVLWEQSPLCVSDLGLRLGLDSGTLTPLLKRMQVHDLVERRRCGEDERKVLIALTARGDSLREPARAIPAAIVRRLGLPRSELERLRAGVQRLTRCVGT